MAKQYYCFLERFNNYFNRKLIRKETLEDYQDASSNSFIPTDSEGSMTPFDFNPNDNITTEIIVNDVPFDPDYFLLMDTEQNIVQRWFVMEQKRNRKGQWLYFLRRDVLADSFEELKNSPMYVEKGIINDLNSPLLLNNENVKVNQIKKKEYLLKDTPDVPFLVLYLKKGVLGNTSIGPNGDGTLTINVSQSDDFVYQTLATPITSWGYYQYSNSDYKIISGMTFEVFLDIIFSGGMSNPYVYSMPADNPTSSNIAYGTRRGNLLTSKEDIKDYLDAQFRPNASTLKSEAISAFGYQTSNPLEVYDNKIIKDSTGKYFRIRVYENGSGNENQDITSTNAPTLKGTLDNLWLATGETETPNNNVFRVTSQYRNIRLEITELPDFQTTINLGDYTGDGTTDSALFDVLCLPYGFMYMLSENGGFATLTCSKERSMAIMTSITTQLTSKYVLDLQILPYLPARTFKKGSNNMTLPDNPNGTCLVGKYSGAISDLLVVCQKSNISFDLWATSAHNPLVIEDDSDVPESFKRKYVNDCTMIRLCSPNYAGIFEFNLAKNGGSIKDINVDMTLRPYNPYIHANPDFKFLYGQDYNDSRGLICGGDFSLGIIDDAWYNYEIQNKNYQAIFDRQIQNLDVNNAIAREEAVYGAIAGTVQGSASGAITGGVTTGSPYGAIAGAVIGGGASAIGGALDLANLEKRQKEARSFAIDNYNLQLGNVRALPNSITKTSALTYNNKILLFYEIYECSEEEKQAYYLKLKYNGMTVGKIDTISPYLSPDSSNYFRAKLIRNTEISEDNHFFETINEELMKGVYI